MFSAICVGLRAVLIMIASVVFGLSVSLAKQQAVGPVPTETSFFIFVGAIAFFISAAGLAALWLDHFDLRALLVLDAATMIFYLAAGITMTLGLRDIASCTATDAASEYHRSTNTIISGGCLRIDGELACMHAASATGTDLTPGRCHIAHADYVLAYIGTIVGIAMVTVGCLLNRQGRGGTPIPTGSY